MGDHNSTPHFSTAWATFPVAGVGLWPRALYTMVDIMSDALSRPPFPRFLYEDSFAYWLLKWLYVL